MYRSVVACTGFWSSAQRLGDLLRSRRRRLQDRRVGLGAPRFRSEAVSALQIRCMRCTLAAVATVEWIEEGGVPVRYGRWIASTAFLPLVALLWGSRPVSCDIETDSTGLEFTADEEDSLVVQVLVQVRVPDIGIPFNGAVPMFLIPVSEGDEDEECSEISGSIWAVDQCGFETEVTGGECHVNHAPLFVVTAEGTECDEETGAAKCILEGGRCEMTYLVVFTSYEPRRTYPFRFNQPQLPTHESRIGVSPSIVLSAGLAATSTRTLLPGGNS